jgi:hypothetical protein
MAYAEDWGELMFNLHCLSKASARRQFRHHIKYSFGGLCAYCRERKATTVDHIRPRCRGGSSLRSNLIPACHECNQNKGSEPCWRTWFRRQPFYNKIAEELIEEWIKNGHRDIEEDKHDALLLEQWVVQETNIEENEDGTNDRTEICTDPCPL